MYYFLYKTNLYNFENNVKIIKMTLIAIILIVLLKCFFVLSCHLSSGAELQFNYEWHTTLKTLCMAGNR